MERIGRYEIVGLLGQGGAGKVYDAVLCGPSGFRKPVALKVLPPGTVGLEREARLGGLLRHPNLVDVYEFGHADGHEYCAMERVAGGSLAAGLPLAPSAVIDAGLQICAGLTYAHEQVGLVHLDLKPRNLLVERGVVRIADLGIARARGVGSADPIRGTPGYMSPEQARGAAVDARSDLWSLGVVLYELATGRLPRPGRGEPTTWDGNTVEPAFPGVDAPDWLRPVLVRCLAPDPDQRFANAAELAVALGAVRVTGPTLAEALGDAPVVPNATRSAASSSIGSEPDVFVGREDELRDLERRLAAPGVVTLRGVSGIGKTRLARHAARVRAQVHGDRVAFCDLSEARGRAEMLAVVAAVLDLRVPADEGRATDQLGHALAARGSTLVVLDNVEQLPVCGAVVARWRELAPSSRFLVTSTRSLGIRGEEVRVLGPLSTVDAVALLRARAAAKGVEAGDEPDLTELARRLDGLPLALELAACRLGVLSARQIVHRLDDRLTLLRSTEVDRPARHLTLQAALDWSWDLLEPVEQRALAVLSVFAGGFLLEAAEAVIGPGPPWVIDLVERLLDRSWLTARPAGGAPRFDLLETLRLYAAGKVDADTRRDAEVAHGAWFAAQTVPAGPRDPRTVARLTRDLDNVLAAGRRAIVREDAPVAVRTCRLAWGLLQLTGLPGVAIELGQAVSAMASLRPEDRFGVERILANAEVMKGDLEAGRARLVSWVDRAPEDQLGPTCRNLGEVLQALGRPTEARPWFERAVSATTGSERAKAMCGLGVVAYSVGALHEALRWFVDAIAAEDGDLGNLAVFRGNVGLALGELGRHDEAREAYAQALAGFEAIGDRVGAALAEGNLGTIDVAQGRIAAGADRYERVARMARETGRRHAEALWLANLGGAQVRLARMTEARPVLTEAVAIAEAVGDQRILGYALTWLGRLELALDRSEAALAALVRADGVLEAAAAPMLRVDAIATMAEVYHHMGDGRAQAALAQAVAAAAGLSEDSDGARSIQRVQALLDGGTA